VLSDTLVDEARGRGDAGRDHGGCFGVIRCVSLMGRDDVVLNVGGPSRLFLVFGGRALLVGRWSVAAAHRRCGERGSRAGPVCWAPCLPGLRVSGRAAWSRALAARAGWWRRSA
jgi:hypothetical protein